MDSVKYNRRLEELKSNKKKKAVFNTFTISVDSHNLKETKNLKLPWETKDALSFVMSMFQLARQITLIIIGIPLIFVGYRFIIYNVALLAFMESMSYIWTILFMFYSTTERQVAKGTNHVAIVITGIVVGLIFGIMALLFRKFSYIITGVLFGLSISAFIVGIYNSIYDRPLYMEIVSPFTILVVF